MLNRGTVDTIPIPNHDHAQRLGGDLDPMKRFFPADCVEHRPAGSDAPARGIQRMACSAVVIGAKRRVHHDRLWPYGMSTLSTSIPARPTTNSCLQKFRLTLVAGETDVETIEVAIWRCRRQAGWNTVSMPRSESAGGIGSASEIRTLKTIAFTRYPGCHCWRPVWKAGGG
jgi:hypothetical protein